MQNYDKNFEMDPTKQQLGGDPLEDFRENNGRPTGSSQKDLEGNLPDNEDQDRVKANLPERDRFIPEEEIPDEQYFEEILNETEIAGEVEEALDDKNWVERYGLDVEEPKEKKEYKALTYSVEEFDLLEACSKFKARTALPEKFVKQRPMFLKRKDGTGVEMTDEQVLEQVKAYNDCKANNKWRDYHVDEIDFMKRCSAWNYYNRKITSLSKNPPTMADGTALSGEEIENLALQYNEFRTKDAEEFAQLKLEKGEWAQAQFEWVPEYYKGNDQWVSYDLKHGRKGGRIETKYVTKTRPAVNSGTFYYVKNGAWSDKDKTITINFISIRYPTDRNIKIENEREEAKNEMVENEA